MNKFRNFLLQLRKQKDAKRKEKFDAKRNEETEKLKDDFYDQYYTDCAKKHLNRILVTYNRESQESYNSSLDSIKNIGLFNPCADSINYLKTMRWVSKQ